MGVLASHFYTTFLRVICNEEKGFVRGFCPGRGIISVISAAAAAAVGDGPNGRCKTLSARIFPDQHATCATASWEGAFDPTDE